MRYDEPIATHCACSAGQALNTTGRDIHPKAATCTQYPPTMYRLLDDDEYEPASPPDEHQLRKDDLEYCVFP